MSLKRGGKGPSHCGSHGNVTGRSVRAKRRGGNLRPVCATPVRGRGRAPGSRQGSTDGGRREEGARPGTGVLGKRGRVWVRLPEKETQQLAGALGEAPGAAARRAPRKPVRFSNEGYICFAKPQTNPPRSARQRQVKRGKSQPVNPLEPGLGGKGSTPPRTGPAQPSSAARPAAAAPVKFALRSLGGFGSDGSVSFPAFLQPRHV